LLTRLRCARVKRAAKELKDGYYVNLGIGMPMLAPSFLHEGVLVHSSHDDTVKLWNMAAGAAFGEPLQHTAWVLCAAFSAIHGTMVGKPLRGYCGSVKLLLSPLMMALSSHLVEKTR